MSSIFDAALRFRDLKRKYIYAGCDVLYIYIYQYLDVCTYFARGCNLLINSVPDQTSNDDKHGVSPHIVTKGYRAIQLV
jgi:hypothetical protein